jgi:hypothetical protein
MIAYHFRHSRDPKRRHAVNCKQCGEKMYFQHKELLNPPVKRAAYSDRTAWLMAEMSRIAYLKFEEKINVLEEALKDGGFEIVGVFNAEGTQAFLAERISDKMAVLAFRGTEKDRIEDILTDLNARFYHDEKGAKIHNGFYKAFQAVESHIRGKVKSLNDHSVYVTGHSLGGALALIATRALNSDNLAACYAFGSPKVGSEEFDDDIKPPIYRVVNAFDIVPLSPPTHIFEILSLLPSKRLQELIKGFIGYDHHGDLRYLTSCNDFKDVKVVANYSEFFRLIASWKNRKESIKHHDMKVYCEKLAQYALKRKEVP